MLTLATHLFSYPCKSLGGKLLKQNRILKAMRHFGSILNTVFFSLFFFSTDTKDLLFFGFR